jgi:uncharacterized protein YggE
MKILLSSCFLLSLCISVNAQTATAPEKDIIEVTGRAEKEITPDEIYVRILIQEKNESREKISIEQQEEKLRNAVTNAGIDIKNLSVSDVNADYMKIRWKTKEVMTQKAYILKTSTPQQLRKLFTELNKMEVKDAGIDHASHSKIDSLTKTVRLMAIKAAKDKALYLLTAINEKLGNCLVVREDSPSIYLNEANISNNSYSNFSVGRGASYETTPDFYEIGFQNIKLEYSIYCKFEIKH